ncbi:tripartite tricarboxylate transporter substrate binding protein [Siccirubricoccus sp. G192]|uniref:tripartite tricarboxylate transporter substrate binding protein n=1 Tax=Siccirubricoccus sp. G192 TaxID=2849651 RepID=UPI001C2C7CF6|nr:tripartite tricarboxylate transporter substrate binding protein [Siccirubricoccus sp. G192]MBV1797431.1 tripartite tricarboxylate transporter substrate binding protein [Siccirubricoccus sp. G192]
MREPAIPSRRGLLGLAATALAAPSLVPSLGRAAGFPERPIRLIVPWAPGGSTDGQMRALAEIAGRELGQPVIIENRPGARGTLGAAMLHSQARPDGYTIGQIHSGVLSHPFMTRSATWDAATDFTYILAITGYLSGLVVRSDAPWQDWKSLMDHMRANPGQVSVGTSGVGGLSHLVMAQVMEREGTQWLHVPYRGVAETTTALLSGQVDAIADSSGWAPHVDAGRMRILAIWSNDRAKRFPDAPTIKELGHDIGGIAPYGLAGPKGMDPAVVKVLHDAFKKAVFDPAHQAMLARFDMPTLYMTGEDFQKWVAARIPVERDLIKRLGISFEGG